MPVPKFRAVDPAEVRVIFSLSPFSHSIRIFRGTLARPMLGLPIVEPRTTMLVDPIEKPPILDAASGPVTL